MFVGRAQSVRHTTVVLTIFLSLEFVIVFLIISVLFLFAGQNPFYKRCPVFDAYKFTWTSHAVVYQKRDSISPFPDAFGRTCGRLRILSPYTVNKTGKRHVRCRICFFNPCIGRDVYCRIAPWPDGFLIP